MPKKQVRRKNHQENLLWISLLEKYNLAKREDLRNILYFPEIRKFEKIGERINTIDVRALGTALLYPFLLKMNDVFFRTEGDLFRKIPMQLERLSIPLSEA